MFESNATSVLSQYFDLTEDNFFRLYREKTCFSDGKKALLTISMGRGVGSGSISMHSL